MILDTYAGASIRNGREIILQVNLTISIEPKNCQDIVGALDA
jgi:hypothetical protein